MNKILYCVLFICFIYCNYNSVFGEQINTEHLESLSSLKKEIKESDQKIKQQTYNLEQLKKEQLIYNKKIDKLNRQIDTNNKQIKYIENQKLNLKKDAEEHIAYIQEQKSQLNSLLKKLYAFGGNYGIKLLLTKDPLSTSSRYLSYYSYIAKNKNDYISSIEHETNMLLIKQKQLDLKILELNTLEGNNKKTISLLNQVINKKNKKEKELKNTIDIEQKQLQEMQESLKNLEEQIAKQKKILEAKKKKERELAIERAKKEAKKQGRNQEVAAVEISQKIDNATQLKGLNNDKYTWPVKGNILRNFGQARSKNIIWKGLLIGANENSPVRSIADGDILYAGWLNGFGFIVVVDHGQNFLSLYGNNKELKISSGDSIKKGDIIALVGNSGGMQTNSLYFELRHKGQPINPKNYLNRN